jgi:hypothetical protein
VVLSETRQDRRVYGAFWRAIWGLKISDIWGHPLYHARELVPWNARDSWRAIRVLISLIPGQFRRRDASGAHLQQDIPAPNLRRRSILEE